MVSNCVSKIQNIVGETKLTQCSCQFHNIEKGSGTKEREKRQSDTEMEKGRVRRESVVRKCKMRNPVKVPVLNHTLSVQIF